MMLLLLALGADPAPKVENKTTPVVVNKCVAPAVAAPSSPFGQGTPAPSAGTTGTRTPTSNAGAGQWPAVTGTSALWITPAGGTQTDCVSGFG